MQYAEIADTPTVRKSPIRSLGKLVTPSCRLLSQKYPQLHYVTRHVTRSVLRKTLALFLLPSRRRPISHRIRRHGSAERQLGEKSDLRLHVEALHVRRGVRCTSRSTFAELECWSAIWRGEKKRIP